VARAVHSEILRRANSGLEAELFHAGDHLEGSQRRVDRNGRLFLMRAAIGADELKNAQAGFGLSRLSPFAPMRRIINEGRTPSLTLRA
jgi:hypothetical protein